MTFNPSIPLCRLYERTAKKSGKRYLAGKLGGASIAILNTGELSESQQPIWELVVSKPLERVDATQTRKPDAADNAASERGFVRESESEIPF